MPELKKLGFHISYDSNYQFWTISKDGVSIKFYEDSQGLPYIDGAKLPSRVMFAQTVRQAYKGFTKKEAEKATLARKALGLICHPSARDLEYLVSST